MRLSKNPESKMIVGKRIRILLSEMTPMLLDIITRTIATQRDLHIIGKVGRHEDLPEVAERTNADVFITSDSVAGSQQYEGLLHERPHLKVIEIASNDGRGLLYEMQPRRVPLGDMSPVSLLDVIRASARPAGSGAHPTPRLQKAAAVGCYQVNTKEYQDD